MVKIWENMVMAFETHGQNEEYQAKCVRIATYKTRLEARIS
jgi:hypothetical protein